MDPKTTEAMQSKMKRRKSEGETNVRKEGRREGGREGRSEV